MVHIYNYIILLGFVSYLNLDKSITQLIIAHNLRATNDYSHTHTLAYAVNMYELSEMIQWIFRSRIGNNL